MDRRPILEAMRRRMHREPAQEMESDDIGQHDANRHAVESLQQEESMPEGEVVPGSVESEYEDNPSEGVRIHHDTEEEQRQLEEREQERQMLEDESMGDESSLRGKAMGDLARHQKGHKRIYG